MIQDLSITIEKNMKKLDTAIRKRYDVCVARARAEYEYRSALGAEMAQAKAEGMAATSLYDFCRGIDYIAELRCNRDVLVAQEEFLTEMIFYYRTEIKIATQQLEAERRGM